MTAPETCHKVAQREKILDLLAKGKTCQEAAEAAGVTVQAVNWARERARAAADPRGAARRGGVPAGSINGVPLDLAEKFREAAARRKMSAGDLRRRILFVVTRDDLFDALDLEPMSPRKGRVAERKGRAQ